MLGATERATKGRCYAAEPGVLIRQTAGDEAIAEADTLRSIVPSPLGVDDKAHVIEEILTHIAPAPGLRSAPPRATPVSAHFRYWVDRDSTATTIHRPWCGGAT